MYFSRNILSSPKLDFASLFAASIASSRSFLFSTTLIPFPPPPAEALTSIGNPILVASLALVVFSRVGIPSFRHNSFEFILSPINSMVSGSGPIHLIFSDITFRQKSAFSDRKPYPGCMASTFISLALCII